MALDVEHLLPVAWAVVLMLKLLPYVVGHDCEGLEWQSRREVHFVGFVVSQS